MGGSSPRLWGTCSGACPFQPQTRFIPTPVGNMVAGPVHQGSAAVHPHACGEHCRCALRGFNVVGSSPRLWGTCKGRARWTPPLRFIPTPVGNIPADESLFSNGAVHPHACGEHKTRCGCGILAGGSSPRLWGTCHPLKTEGPSLRFIPTPVGNISARPETGCWLPVHPHACGEHPRLRATNDWISGSSPRLWGTYLHLRPQMPLRRFIPTPVGNIHVAQRPGSLLYGSSPRLWGTCGCRDG